MIDFSSIFCHVQTTASPISCSAESPPREHLSTVQTHTPCSGASSSPEQGTHTLLGPPGASGVSSAGAAQNVFAVRPLAGVIVGFVEQALFSSFSVATSGSPVAAERQRNPMPNGSAAQLASPAATANQAPRKRGVPPCPCSCSSAKVPKCQSAKVPDCRPARRIGTWRAACSPSRFSPGPEGTVRGPHDVGTGLAVSGRSGRLLHIGVPSAQCRNTLSAQPPHSFHRRALTEVLYALLHAPLSLHAGVFFTWDTVL